MALVQARKVAMRVKQNTLYSADTSSSEKCLKVDVRRVDSPSIDLSLIFLSQDYDEGTRRGTDTSSIPRHLLCGMEREFVV